MKTTPYTLFKKLAFIIILAFISPHCSQVEDFVIDQDNILGTWVFDKEISYAGEEFPLQGTIEFFNDGTYLVTDNTLGGSEWHFSNDYENPELYILNLSYNKMGILELTSKNMVWKSPDKLYFLSKE